MTKKFKVGDKVRGTGADIEGGEYVIEFAYSNGEGFKLRCVKDGKYPRKGELVDRGSACNWLPYMELVEAAPLNEEAAGPVTHILQYELDKDPFETFTSKAAVEKRIKELSLDSTLKRDSLVVYEVAKVLKVTLDTKVSFSEEKEEEPAPAKASGKRGSKTLPKVGDRVRVLETRTTAATQGRVGHEGTVLKVTSSPWSEAADTKAYGDQYINIKFDDGVEADCWIKHVEVVSGRKKSGWRKKVPCSWCGRRFKHNGVKRHEYSCDSRF